MKGLRSAQLALRSCSYHGAASLPRRASAIAPISWIVNPAASSSSSPTTTSSTSPRHTVAYFSTSPAVHAKKHREKAKKAAANEKNSDEWDEDQLPSESRHKTRDKFTPPSDFDHEAAFDLGDVDTAYAKIDERFEKRLQEFKASGGRFNPDMLGQLKVKTTGGAEGGAATLYPLRELASIVHRGGRSVSLLVSDASYIKPIMSAVQNSEQFNQQPQRDPDNDLELLLRIEPENPDEQAKRLKAECNGWKDAVRDVLATRKSKHATWQKAKHLTKDDVKNLDKKVKALQDKKIEAIEKKEKQLLVELANRQKRL